MCGISGAIGTITRSQVEAVQRMNRALQQRGPDDEGLWTNRATDAPAGPGVVLGHRRLSILDLSPLGHQPMVDAASGCSIAYNGEIYNFKELRDELISAGVAFRSQTDTEVLLAAYVQWGRDCLQRLRGMFAFALWDPRAEVLLLARDRLGVKPLYYTRVQRPDGTSTVYFASELRALLATDEVPRRLDPVGLSTYLWNGVVVGPRTLVRDCHLLPQGTFLSLGTNTRLTSPQRYWQLPSAQPLDATESVESLKRELADAVQMRMVSDVPLGIFLSGGIDSSAIAALAMRSAPGPVTTFNISFDEGRYDESPHARAVAEALGTDHHEVRLTGDAFRAQLDDALHSLDQPTFDAINTYFVSRAVREAGITVALAGTGGDELFGGYPSFRDLPRARQVSRHLGSFPDAWLASAGRAVSRLMVGQAGAVPPQTRWGKLSDLFLARGDLLQLYQVSYGLFTQSFLKELSADFDLTPYGVPAQRKEELHALIADQPDLHAISMLESTFFLGERLLRDTDAASMAVSLEVRVPLLDHRVVEAVAKVPQHVRFQPLGRKALLRTSAMPHLDPAMFDRPKAGFELPLDMWCRQQLRPEMDGLLSAQAPAESLGLDGRLVSRLWRAYQAGGAGLYWSRIWSLYTLLWWCREHNIHR